MENQLKKSYCIDYLKFRIDGLIDMPTTEQEFLDNCKYDEEPGSADFSFINELCSILLIKSYLHYDNFPGWQGFKFYSIFDEDILVFGGRKSEQSEDGIDRSHVELKGHALRLFEIRCQDNNIDVFSQYKKLFDFIKKYTISTYEKNLQLKRIDVAVDDYSNFICIDELKDKLRHGFFTTGCRKIGQSLDYTKEEKEDNDLINEIISKGWTAYIGGRTSRQLCIYDKKAERETAGCSVIVDHWIRYEARFYQNNSQAAFNVLYNDVFYPNDSTKFNQTVNSLINKIIVFREDNNAKRENQKFISVWWKWDELLKASYIEFKPQAAIERDTTFFRKKNWLIKSPYLNITLQFLTVVDIHYENGLIKYDFLSLRKVFEMSGLYFQDRFLSFIFALLKRAVDENKITEEKLAIVNNFRKRQNLEYIKTVSDAENIIEQYIDGQDDLGYMATRFKQEGGD